MLRGPIRFTNVLAGTNNFIYPGPVVDMQSPASAGAVNGATYVYYAQSLDMSEWEIGSGAYNSGTGTFARTTIAANSLGTTAKISFTNAPQIVVFDTATAFMTIADVSVATRGAIDGLTVSPSGGTSSFSVASGVATSSSATDILALGSALTKTTAAWAAGSGNGALDAGAVAINTWYHVWLIKNPTTLAVDILISLSPTAPTMPSGFTLKRLIWSLKTDAGGTWLALTQVGDEGHWAANIVELAAVAITVTTGNTITLAGVPTGFACQALFHGAINPGASANGVLFTSLDENDVAVLGATGSRNASLWAQTSGSFQAGDFQKRVNASAQMRWRAFAAQGDMGMYTYGFVHPRGRNA